MEDDCDNEYLRICSKKIPDEGKEEKDFTKRMRSMRHPQEEMRKRWLEM